MSGFTENLPSRSWGHRFVQRHKARISTRVAKNIKRVRAAVTEQVIRKYIEELGKSCDGVPPTHILNFDESGFQVSKLFSPFLLTFSHRIEVGFRKVVM